MAPDRYEWVQYQIEFLGYMVSSQGVEMMNKKLQIVKEIEPVSSLKDAKDFLGFANFYRRFIKDYSKIILSMTNTTSFDMKY